MILTLLGIILLLTPFFLIFYFKNRILGFLYVLTGLSAFHIFLSLVSQYFHFFRYPIILSAQVIIALLVIAFFIKNKKKFSFKIKIGWIVIFSLAIIIFELWSVHYFYSGEIVTIFGRQNVSQVSYPYPYFSDDWAGVAFTNYSINNNALPITNPLMNGAGDKNFPNIFVAFFAALAEIFLVLNLSPLIGFPILALVSGSLICILVYLFLKSSQVESFFALLGALCLPWIMCSVNLPGIWNLFPFIGATVLFFVSLIALNLKNRRLALISGLVSLFLYPPFIVVIAPTLLIEFLLSSKISFKRFLTISLGTIAFVALVSGLIFILQKENWPSLVRFFLKSLVRINDQGTIPHRAIWEIIPAGLLPLALIGVYSLVRKKIFCLVTPLAVGLLYWLVYAYCPYFLIIDYARIVLITAYLLMIAVGLGAAEIFNFLRKKYPFLVEKDIYFAFKIIILAIFVALSFSYTSRSNWRKLTLKYETASGVYDAPIYSPVNNYLNQDDFALFQGIYQKRFLSLPWKGLAIGAATGNYPLNSKASIITNNVSNYDRFMNENCDDKIAEAKLTGLDYVYSFMFYCPNFLELGHSREELYLYKFKP